MKIIESNNIFSENVNSYLNNLIKASENFIYISPIQSIYKERLRTNPTFNQLNNNKIFTSKDKFEKFIFNNVLVKKGYLPSVDMYFILRKLIEIYFHFDSELLNTYKTVCYQLFDLYKLLIFYDVSNISNDVLIYIKDNYPMYCFYIFDIFNKFQKILNDIKNQVDSSNEDIVTCKIDDLEIVLSLTKSEDNNFNNFINKEKQEIINILSNVDTVYLDGFISFTDMDKYIINQANKMKKEIVFITRNIQDNPNKEFLINKVYSCEYSPDYNLINLNENKKSSSECINLIRKNFYKSTVQDNNDLLSNGEVNFVEPFMNKYEELKYIAKKVGEIVKEEKSLSNNPEKIKEFIENEIVIVSSADGNFNSKLLEEQFCRSGVFLRKEGNIDLLRMGIKAETLKNIYYDIDEFLKEDVLFEDGTKLNNQEKMILWKKGFSKISLKNKNSSILSSPIFEFIFQIYNISDEGLDAEKFKQILFSNWYYYTYQSDLKWSKLLGAFNQIEIYFKRISSVDDWIQKLNEIIDIKINICDDSKYMHHPVSCVKLEELKNLLSIMEEIRCLSNILSNKHGNFAQHIEFLKKRIIYSDKIFSLNDEELTEAQILIKRFCNIIDNIVSDSTIQNLDSVFFMRHIRNILSSFENYDEEKDNNIRINVQSMLNLKHYNYVLFIGLENNKYPREHNLKFPFTPEIIKIMNNIGIYPYSIDIYKNNLMMENFFFKNVIDFANKELWFTCTKYYKKTENKFSLYANDIATLFNSEIKFYKLQNFNKKNNDFTDCNYPQLYLKPKDEYTLKELITFQLCPKLYYHKYVNPNELSYETERQLRLYAESVLYYDLFDKFKEYNFENKKWYSASNGEFKKVLEHLSEISFKEHAPNFSFLNPSVLESIKERAFSRIVRFIENYVIDTLEYYTYTIVNSQGEIYPIKDFRVKLDYDTAIFCKDKKKSKIICQNNIYLDFLTLKCTPGEVYERHYKDMLNRLKEKNKYTDRIFLANRMLSKINIQFASNVERFIKGNNGGIERVVDLKDRILRTDFLKLLPCQSNFCEYCIVKNVCTGGKEIIRFLEVIE